MEGLRSSTVEDQGRQAEVQRVKELMVQAMAGDLQQIAELFVSKKDRELFGPTEFQLRDLVLRAGARALEAVVEDRKKGGTKAAARSVPTVAGMPGLSVGAGGT